MHQKGVNQDVKNALTIDDKIIVGGLEAKFIGFSRIDNSMIVKVVKCTDANTSIADEFDKLIKLNCNFRSDKNILKFAKFEDVSIFNRAKEKNDISFDRMDVIKKLTGIDVVKVIKNNKSKNCR